MRRDGFASVSASVSSTPGVLDTVPLEYAGEHLFVNAKAAKGTLEVALLDGRTGMNTN